MKPEFPERRTVGRVSHALIAHPLIALATTATIAATGAVAVNAGITIGGWSANAHDAAAGWRSASDAGIATHLGATLRSAPGMARSGSMPAPGNAAGQAIGRALTGNAIQHVSLRRAETLANQTPARASVDRASDAIRLTGRKVVLTIAASPPGSDMRFLAAGLTNPTIEVARGARVRIHFINADSDSAHGWMLLDPVVHIGNVVHGPCAFPGAFALLGDPNRAGQPEATLSFTASTSGTYRYQCPVPGHAAMGMQGSFVVSV